MLKLSTFATTILLLSGLTSIANAENISHVQQLISTKSCLQCDLSRAGLATNDLTGAKLGGANLAGANLSRANLTGADLRGANLSGASLYGANLSGADLRGANVNSTDLRTAYFANANLQGIDVRTAYLEGATGLPKTLGTAEDFYKWGFAESQKNDFLSAIEHYTMAIDLKPQLADAYLARAMAKFQLQDDVGATKDAFIAQRLYSSQSSTQGSQIAHAFLVKIELASKPTPIDTNAGNGNMVDLITGLSSLLLKFF